MSVLRVLHLEDNEADAEFVRITLEEDRLDCAIDRVASKAGFEDALLHRSYDVILSDFSMPGYDGLGALALAQKVKPEVPFLFLSGTIGEERAVESLRNGAVDYLLKDSLQRLSPAIQRARREALERLDKRRKEEQIRQQAELLNQTQDAIFVGDLAQNITYWNKAAERIYGWTEAEALGRKSVELLHRAGSQLRDDMWGVVLEKGEWSGEVVQVAKDGKELQIFGRRTVLRDLEGHPLAVLSCDTDITEKKDLEAQVLRSQRLESIGSLAGGIAHDLNNILAPILLVTDLLRVQSENPGQLRMLDIARTSAQRGADLVKQILQFSRGAKHSETLCRLEVLTEEMARLAAKTFPPEVSLQTEIQKELPPVSGDPTQIHQILLNLCVNARDAMPKGGRMLIQLRLAVLADRLFARSDAPVSGAFVALSVTDTGVGIPNELLPRIFDPFFTTKAEGKGTGLGLSTVAAIVRNHQGFLDVRSAVGQGTTIEVFLPAVEEAPLRTVEALAEGTPAGQGEWVLLVDDELALLEMTKELLEAHNYHVLTARSGLEALARFNAHQEKIAVVIADLIMPDLRGDELLSDICERFPETLSVCLSGSGDGEAWRIEPGATRVFLRKPCPTKDLLAALHRLLRPARAGNTHS